MGPILPSRDTPWSAIEQLGHFAAKSVGNRIDVVDAEVSLATFDRPDVRPVQASLVCQVLLAERQRPPKISNPLSEVATSSQVFLGRLSHWARLLER
jgi:hypothetical protein